MKSLKSSLLLMVAIATFGSAPFAHAVLVPDGSYAFTSTDGDTALDGSYVTFSGDSIVDWYMNDSAADTNGVPTDIPLTPSNSSIASMGVLGPDAWYFVIDGNNIATQPFDSFEGQDNLFGPGAGGGTGSLYDGFGDPDGNWSPRVASVPDSGSSLGLLGIGFVGIACASRLRRRAQLATC